MQTTATWDPSSRQFIIHSPTTLSDKYWITNSAVHAQWSVVFAQLIMQGKNQGIHGFLVRYATLCLQALAAPAVNFEAVFCMLLTPAPAADHASAASGPMMSQGLLSSQQLALQEAQPHTHAACSWWLHTVAESGMPTCAPAMESQSVTWGTRWAATGWTMAD